VTCKVPFDFIEGIAKNENITGVCSIPKTISEVGTYTTAGDGILGAATARSTYSLNGAGYKVGIISDGVTHYQDAITSGDLPSNFQVVNNRIGGDEGTAMAEIVYDMAPAVSLAFSDAFIGESGIVNSITALRNAGCNIIVDDIYYPLEPIFEDGSIAIAIDDATANGVKYISSAGNYGNTTWFGQSADANNNSWMEFSGSTEVNSIDVQPDETFRAILQWANKWNKSGDDYDLYLFSGPDPTSTILNDNGGGTRRQTGNGQPYEYIEWKNRSTVTKTVYLRVKFYSVNSPRVIKLVGIGGNSFDYITDGSVKPHAAAASCISVGAIDADNPQTMS
jgi:hypothetical protein